MPESNPASSGSLTRNQRLAVLIVAFMAWFFGGVQIGITNVAMRASSLQLMDQVGDIELEEFDRLNRLSNLYRKIEIAEEELSKLKSSDQTSDDSSSGSSERMAALEKLITTYREQIENVPGKHEPLTQKEQAQQKTWSNTATTWYGWNQCAFLFGAAAGGFIFGRLGDRLGRTKTLALSIFCFATLTWANCFVTSPTQQLILRFLACLGIGGTWPNGVALVSEAWSNAARPVVSSAIGMAGNLGIFCIFTSANIVGVTPESWRWVMIVGGSPVILAAIIWFLIPESPAWLRAREESPESDKQNSGDEADTGNKSFRYAILVGIALATIPLAGGWGSANWMIPWAESIGEQTGQTELKSEIGMARSITSIVGSLIAGWIAIRVGRRLTYAITSIGALLVAQYAFGLTAPGESDFLIWVALLGFFNGLYFGWLPFFLPEMFEARVRSAGAGISFNSGRILTAITIFATTAMRSAFDNDFSRIGQVTSWVFLLGAIAVAFAPDTSRVDMSTDSESEEPQESS